MRKHPEQRSPVRVHGPRPASPHEVEAHGDAIVTSRQPESVEPDASYRLQSRVPQVHGLDPGLQRRPLVEAGEVGHIGDHPRGGGDSVGSPFEELAVLLPLVRVVETVANHLARSPEGVEGSHDVVECAGEEAVEHPQAPLVLLEQQLRPSVPDLPRRVVPYEAAGVTERPVGVVGDVRVDEKIHQLPVLGPKPYRDVGDGVPGPKLLEYLQDQSLLIGAEVHYGLPDVLLGGVAQDVELGLVGPEDSAVAVEPVHGDGGVLKEVD
mmetsp:Transcript_44202/g.94105  ORF Transcript_44202/g.94105 Transcript_44202/m.94105 type:complete len:266 (+) Transcript_44202:455-1252(+)